MEVETPWPTHHILSSYSKEKTYRVIHRSTRSHLSDEAASKATNFMKRMAMIGAVHPHLTRQNFSMHLERLGVEAGLRRVAYTTRKKPIGGGKW
jgi:hypothetical protein